METAIGVFDSREHAEGAVKELLQMHVPEESIVFLTRSESEAMSFGKELGTYAGGFLGGAVGTTAGCVGAALAMIPGFGQVFALGVGGAALLGYLGSKVGGTLAKGIAESPGTPKPASSEKSGEEGAHLLEVLKQGRSVIVVRTEFHDVAAAASGVLDRLGLGKQGLTAASRSQTATRQAGDVTIIDATGRIAFGEGATKLRETVANLTAGGAKKVVLNLKEVEFVDSSGMGEMVRCHMVIRKQGGQLKLANLSKMVNELLQATAMNKVFDIQADEDSALRSFGEKGLGASAN
jgi:anti-sigma B factor antagonist